MCPGSSICEHEHKYNKQMCNVVWRLKLLIHIDIFPTLTTNVTLFGNCWINAAENRPHADHM